MLNKLIRNIILLVALFSFFSCEETEEVVQKQVFFSLTEYFENQIELLGQQNFSLEKSITINEQSEKKEIKQADYKTELASFIANDINRPSWADKYTVDSLIQEGYLAGIRYTAKEESLYTRKLNVEFRRNGEVKLISLEQASSSALSDTKKSMSYLALQNYRIKSTETNMTGDEVTVDISGLFLKED